MRCVRSALAARACAHTCRIPKKILGKVFLLYQQAYAVPYIPETGSYSRAGLTLENTSLYWVPGVVHVCRHWRAVALDYPRLWLHITLHLGLEWATRMLTLSKSSPITFSLVDPDPCEACIPPDTWSPPLPPL